MRIGGEDDRDHKRGQEPKPGDRPLSLLRLEDSVVHQFAIRWSRR
jgi:hypothetical protein